MRLVSPIIFCLYKWDELYKYADNKALVALLWKDCIDYEYEEHVLKLEKWCKASSTEKCWEDKIIDLKSPRTEITSCDQPVDILKVFKYLGTMIDCKLIFFW